MIPIDGDMLGFLWATGAVLFASKPQLRKNSKPIPVRYQRELLEDSQLTEQQRKYIAPLDAQLATLGFLPFYTLRVTNYGSNLVRGYQNPSDPASCTLTIVEVKTNVKGVTGVKNSQVVNFTTRFSGGNELVTRNMALKSVLEQPEYKIVQDCRNTTNLAALKKTHDAKAATLGTPVSPPRDIRSVIEEFDKDHDRYNKYQVQQGAYRLNAQNDAYLLTDKVFNRGIQNFFNPFAKRISLTTALFSVLVGAVLPLYGILKLAPAAADSFGPGSARSVLHPATLAILACYVLTGVILGFIAESQSYVWVMLVTYIPAHLIAGWTFGGFPFSSVAFAVSYYVCQAKRKRQLILQT
ncbi:MAG TPA: hypothetical protein VJX70_14030 [Candidatus Acidoferrum sp.]|nr:hypothetical protein [Candidatus Acidoferrum sp.]